MTWLVSTGGRTAFSSPPPPALKCKKQKESHTRKKKLQSIHTHMSCPFCVIIRAGRSSWCLLPKVSALPYAHFHSNSQILSNCRGRTQNTVDVVVYITSIHTEELLSHHFSQPETATAAVTSCCVSHLCFCSYVSALSHCALQILNTLVKKEEGQELTNSFHYLKLD